MVFRAIFNLVLKVTQACFFLYSAIWMVQNINRKHDHSDAKLRHVATWSFAPSCGRLRQLFFNYKFQSAASDILLCSHYYLLLWLLFSNNSRKTALYLKKSKGLQIASPLVVQHCMIRNVFIVCEDKISLVVFVFRTVQFT